MLLYVVPLHVYHSDELKSIEEKGVGAEGSPIPSCHYLQLLITFHRELG